MEPASVDSAIGCSPLANALGATIKVGLPQQGMYLVIGNGVSPEPMVQRHQGATVLRLSGFKVLATLPFAGYITLKTNRNIRAIGPVTVDTRRLSKIVELLGRTGNSNPGG